MSEDDYRKVFQLEAEVSSAVDEHLADAVFYRTLRAGGEEYEAEECEQADDPWVLVRKSDGERFQVEVEVFAHKLSPKKDPATVDAAVAHIPGQEELPL